MRKCIVYLCGLTRYENAWRFQRLLAEHVHVQKKAARAGTAKWPDDHMLVLQHPRIFTLGRGATKDNLRFDVDWETGKPVSQDMFPEVLRVERGGEVTWHGPGQLVAYPILDLNNDRPGPASSHEASNTANVHKKDLHWYTSQLEECVIKMLQSPPYSVPGVGRHDINTGVWVRRCENAGGAGSAPARHEKISAIGVTASRWITMHGLSLNVNVDFSDYSLIIPCGIQEKETPHDRASSTNISVESVQKDFIKSFEEVFRLDLEVMDGPAALQALSSLEKEYPHIAEMRLQRNI
eukprot:GSChrysophyteH1.ASY1.ANO1.1197.1 assembled CDS